MSHSGTTKRLDDEASAGSTYGTFVAAFSLVYAAAIAALSELGFASP